MNTMTLSLLAALLPLAGFARADSAREEAAAALAKPLPPVFDPAAIDKSADPCVDFYQYSCGQWLKDNPVPPDQTVWYRFSELDEHTRAVLEDILQKAADDKSPKSENERKIGDDYAACMDESAIDAKGLKPFQAELDRVNAMTSMNELPAEVARLQLLGAAPLFSFGSTQDYQDASRMIATADQGGISLPDRDYYLTDEFKKERDAYGAHLRRMFSLLGDDDKKAAAEADAVLRVETALAKVSMSRDDRREPKNVHHKMDLASFETLSPTFDWKAYLDAVGAPRFKPIDAADPAFFSGMDLALQSVPLGDWKAYLRWNLIHGLVAMAPKPFVDEDFDFFGRTLNGQQTIKARWKRCVEAVDAGIGEALGQAYVEREFTPAAKKRVLGMVHEVEKAMADDIKGLDWMSPETKTRALKKLALVANKIGYPDKWRDYSKLQISRDDALGNLERADAFEFHRQLAKIGRAVDRGEWDMTPPTDNAYYDPQLNDINFPAGILQPPNFDAKADDAANYGDLVAVVGHELTHGFDDEGRHYDGHGNLKDWWTAEDAKAFDARAQGLVDEYSKFVALADPRDPSKDIHLDGRLTLGENTADNGGFFLAYAAFTKADAASLDEKVDGYDARQRYFLSYGQAWCVNRADEYAKRAAKTDPHSPGKYRVDGVVSNSLEFRKAFSCREGSPMAPAKINRVW